MTTETLYQQAHFKELKNLGKSDIYVMGAHCFTGDHQRTRWLAEDLWPNSSPIQQAFISFHLGVSLTRTSHYKKAAQVFKRNLQLAEHQLDQPKIVFLAWQGLGFFNYFFSRHNHSLKAAQKARRALERVKDQANKTLFEILCLDLEGHNLIHRYRIHKGIEVLQKAHTVATENGVQSFSQSLELSILLYTCQYIYSPSRAIPLLKKALKEWPTDDDYSRSELVCLISNLLMLTGRFQEAQDYLSEHYKVIYQTENKRQMGQLNFRMTYNMFRRGSFEQALYLAKTARSNLNPVTDRNLIAKILGLEIKILEAMGEPTKESIEKLANLNTKIESFITQRANFRTLKKIQSFNEGEDPCGDVIDRMRGTRTKNLYLEILKGGYFGLLSEYFNRKPGEEFILFNAPDGHSLVNTHEKCHRVTKKLGPTLSKLLIQIGQGAGDKENLIKSVWGYTEYDPLRHDSLIYTSMARLRSLLSIDENRLFFDGQSYRCRMTVIDHLQDTGEQVSTAQTKTEPLTLKADPFVLEISPDLNYRQIKVLKSSQLDTISVKNYSEQFEITTMTALRDLKKLCELGYLKKTGRARSTRYLKVFKT